MEFGGKIFNPMAFTRYLETLPRMKRNELLKSGAIFQNHAKASEMRSQTTTHMITEPMFGLIGGEPVNYDGVTDIETHETGTAKQTKVVIGRANGWKETDFAQDIAATDFMANVGMQVNSYWDDRDQETLIAILDGVFSMTGVENKKFVDSHTYKVDKPMGPTTLNIAAQRALGDNKNALSMIIMHSRVATTLENLNLLEYVKYTDNDGIERVMDIARYNGKLVLIDDSMPFDEKTGEYTSYILGRSMIGYTPVQAKVPNEVVREAKEKGGYTELITRRRRLIEVYGISYTDEATSSLSPTNKELANGKNWELVKTTDGKTIDPKAIAIGRIITVEDPVETETESETGK